MKKEKFVFKAIVSFDDHEDDADYLFKKYNLHILRYDCGFTYNAICEFVGPLHKIESLLDELYIEDLLSLEIVK